MYPQMDQKYVRKKQLSWIRPRKNNIRARKINNTPTYATFQVSLRITLSIGQVFSLMPVSGVCSKNASDVRLWLINLCTVVTSSHTLLRVWGDFSGQSLLRCFWWVLVLFITMTIFLGFKPLSWKCGYSLVSLIGQMFITVLCVYKVVISNATLNNSSPIIFNVTSCCTMAMFFQIARCWPDLVQHIARAEEINPNFDDKLAIKCNVTCAVVLLLALLEHILSLLSALAGASVCYPHEDLYEGFVRHVHPWIFNHFPFSTVLVVVTQFFFFQSTFVWNYCDLFIISISYYLSSRLEHINKKLKAAHGKYLPEMFWRSAREDYCRATQLVRKVDKVISGLVLISFANNLYFICLQLFNTLDIFLYVHGTLAALCLLGSMVKSKNQLQLSTVLVVASIVHIHHCVHQHLNIHKLTPKRDRPSEGIKGRSECTSRFRKTTLLGGYEEPTYFMFSLIFLISRSVAVSFIASQVNDASEKPVPVLYDVPSPVYCLEVQRFLDQINGEKVALSGLQFFSVTRGLLLTVAGTIVTYELVMVQFSSSGPQTNATNFLFSNTTNMSRP